MHTGQRVLFDGKYCGTLRYLGHVDFAKHVWAGIELDEPVGKNNGTVKGRYYFKCLEDHGIFTKKSRLVPLPNIEVGARVVVKKQHIGVVQYVGLTHFSPGLWIGVALKRNVGKHDGTVEGKRYFECEPEHGVFVRVASIAVAQSAFSSPASSSRVQRDASQDGTTASANGHTSSMNGDSETGAVLHDGDVSSPAITPLVAKANPAPELNDATKEPSHATHANVEKQQDAAEASDTNNSTGPNGTVPPTQPHPTPKGAGTTDPISALLPSPVVKSNSSKISLGDAGDYDTVVAQLQAEREKVRQLGFVLMSAKKAMTESIAVEARLRYSLEKHEHALETAESLAIDLAIRNDTLEAEVEALIRTRDELSDRLADCQMELLDAQTEQFNAITECEMMAHELTEARARLRAHNDSLSTSIADLPDDEEDDDSRERVLPLDAAHTAADSSRSHSNTDSQQQQQHHHLPPEGQAKQEENAHRDNEEEVVEESAHHEDQQRESDDDEEEEEEKSDAGEERRTSLVDVSTRALFCTVCEEYGHLAQDCDDTITF